MRDGQVAGPGSLRLSEARRRVLGWVAEVYGECIVRVRLCEKPRPDTLLVLVAEASSFKSPVSPGEIDTPEQLNSSSVHLLVSPSAGVGMVCSCCWIEYVHVLIPSVA